MVVVRPSRNLELAFISIGLVLLASAPALAQQGSVLTTLENSVATAANGWETTVMNAARSLFWILAGIEVGIAAVWLAINAASLDSWFAELVRRIMFIGRRCHVNLYCSCLRFGLGVNFGDADTRYQFQASSFSATGRCSRSLALPAVQSEPA